MAVSHTGSTKDILESARIARKAGAKVIGILGSQNRADAEGVRHRPVGLLA